MYKTSSNVTSYADNKTKTTGNAWQLQDDVSRKDHTIKDNIDHTNNITDVDRNQTGKKKVWKTWALLGHLLVVKDIDVWSLYKRLASKAIKVQ